MPANQMAAFGGKSDSRSTVYLKMVEIVQIYLNPAIALDKADSRRKGLPVQDRQG